MKVRINPYFRRKTSFRKYLRINHPEIVDNRMSAGVMEIPADLIAHINTIWAEERDIPVMPFFITDGKIEKNSGFFENPSLGLTLFLENYSRFSQNLDVDDPESVRTLSVETAEYLNALFGFEVVITLKPFDRAWDAETE